MHTKNTETRRVEEILEFIFQSASFPQEMPIDLTRDEADRLEETSDELGQLRLSLDLSAEHDDLDDLEWALLTLFN